MLKHERRSSDNDKRHNGHKSDSDNRKDNDDKSDNNVRGTIITRGTMITREIYLRAERRAELWNASSSKSSRYVEPVPSNTGTTIASSELIPDK
jgi:hypothetical protein